MFNLFSFWNVIDKRCVFWNDLLKLNLTGHSSSVTSFIEMSNYIISGSNDFKVKVWNKDTGLLVQNLTAQSGAIINLQPLTETTFASLSFDRTVVIYTISNFSVQIKFATHNNPISNLCKISNDTLIISSNIGNSDLYNTTTGTYTNVGGSYVSYFLLLSNQKLLASDTYMRVWNVNPVPGSVYTPPIPAGQSLMMEIPNKNLFATVSGNVINIYNMSSYLKLTNLTGHTLAINSMQMISASLLISASKDNTMRIWDISKGSCLKTVVGNFSSLKTQSNGILVSGDNQGKIQYWNLTNINFYN